MEVPLNHPLKKQMSPYKPSIFGVPPFMETPMFF